MMMMMMAKDNDNDGATTMTMMIRTGKKATTRITTITFNSVDIGE